MTIKHAILVREADDDDPQRTAERPLCDTVYKSGEITDRNARESGATIFVMKNIRVDVWPRLHKEIEENKKY